MLTQEQITKNAETVVKLIEKYVVSDRKDKLLKMLEKIGTQFYTAPAATSYHSAFNGGLVYHTLAVVKNMLEICQIWYQDVSKESVVICSLFHDIGKCVTVKGEDIYVPNESQWHREKLGKMYEKNPIIRDGLTHAQRSIRLLSYFEINLTDEEYLAILSHDGIYVEENVVFKNKMNKLALMLHWSDMKAAIIDEK